MEARQYPNLEINLSLKASYSVVLESIIQGLKHEGFVVVTELDLQEALKRKLDVDTHPFKVIRVYHPALSGQFHLISPGVGLLPYNLTITQLEDGNVSISVVDPLPQHTLAENPGLIPIVSQGHNLLHRLVESLPGL